MYDSRNYCCNSIAYTFVDDTNDDPVSGKLDSPATYSSANPSYITVKVLSGDYDTLAKYTFYLKATNPAGTAGYTQNS